MTKYQEAMLAEATPTGRCSDGVVDEEALRQKMIRYQRADPDAADELVRCLSPMLLRFLFHPGHSRSDTEDLLQECWLRVHKSRHTYRPSAPVLPWIFAIARHTRLDGYRRRARQEAREIAMERIPDSLGSSDPVIHDPDAEFHRMVGDLPEGQREVLLMMKVSGMSLEEVARATSTTVGAVKQKAHRAYEKLRKKLENVRFQSAGRR